MHEQDLVRHKTTEPPVVIRAAGLSVEATQMFRSIARRAYEIFESKGRLMGRDLENWFEAEAELFQLPPTKVSESPEGVTVRADVHGFAARELEIDLEPQRVTIIGRHQSKANGETNGRMSSERRTARLLRSLQLPIEVDTHHASARLKRGILELDVKKALAAEKKTLQTSPGETTH